jgi:hypothetical protein
MMTSSRIRITVRYRPQSHFLSLLSPVTRWEGGATTDNVDASTYGGLRLIEEAAPSRSRYHTRQLKM